MRKQRCPLPLSPLFPHAVHFYRLVSDILPPLNPLYGWIYLEMRCFVAALKKEMNSDQHIYMNGQTYLYKLFLWATSCVGSHINIWAISLGFLRTKQIAHLDSVWFLRRAWRKSTPQTHNCVCSPHRADARLSLFLSFSGFYKLWMWFIGIFGPYCKSHERERERAAAGRDSSAMSFLPLHSEVALCSGFHLKETVRNVY